MILTVTDDGLGISTQEAEEINEVLKLTKRPESFRHFGLFNINKRIVNTYGNRYGLSIAGKTGSHTTVTIKLPIQIPYIEKGKQYV